MKRHISEIELEAAQTAIRVKISILEEWLKEGNIIPWLSDDQGVPIRDIKGELQIDFYPDCVSAFCTWNGTQNSKHTSSSMPHFTSTNRGTLDGEKYGQLKISVDLVCAALRAKAEAQLLKANKTNQIDELEAQVRFWKELSQKQETDIAQLRERYANTEIMLRNKERAIQNAADEHCRVVADLEARNAELGASISKLVPLKLKGEE